MSSPESVAAFPGDELIPCPKKTITYATTINAPPERIWPWLLQIGAGRAGWYSYDRIDNGGMASARRIIPALQQLKMGDLVPAIPHTKDAFLVSEVCPCRALVLVVPNQTAAEATDNLQRLKGPLRVSWALVLERVDQQRTKLVSRGRISADWLKPSVSGAAIARKAIFIERIYGLLARMPWWLMAPIALTGHYLMEARMLHGIKWRAESLAHSPAP